MWPESESALIAVRHAAQWVVGFATHWLVLSSCVAWAIIFVLYLIWYVRTPRLHFVDTARNRRLMRSLPQLKRRFWPTFYLAHQMLQSAVANFYRRSPHLPYERELVTMRDGEVVALDWYRREPSKQLANAYHQQQLLLQAAGRPDPNAPRVSPNADDEHLPAPDPTTPTVIVLHGLAGSAHEPNVQILTKHIRRAGYRVCVWNRRGCALNLRLRLAKPYMYGDTRDMADVVDHLSREYPHSALLAVGLSAGSNPLVKYLGERGDRSKIVAGMSVCNAFDLDRCSRLLATRPFYDSLMVNSLKHTLFERHIDTFGGVTHKIDLPRIRKARSVRDFDHLFTCQLHGYDDVTDYHLENSSISYMGGVRVPLFCLNALDDPIVHDSLIPYSHALANPQVLIATTHGGGHLGWVSGPFPFTGPSWMEQLCVAYLHGITRELAHTKQQTPSQRFLDSLVASTAAAHTPASAAAGAAAAAAAALQSPRIGTSTPPKRVDYAASSTPPFRPAVPSASAGPSDGPRLRTASKRNVSALGSRTPSYLPSLPTRLPSLPTLAQLTDTLDRAQAICGPDDGALGAVLKPPDLCGGGRFDDDDDAASARTDAVTGSRIPRSAEDAFAPTLRHSASAPTLLALNASLAANPPLATLAEDGPATVGAVPTPTPQQPRRPFHHREHVRPFSFASSRAAHTSSTTSALAPADASTHRTNPVSPSRSISITPRHALAGAEAGAAVFAASRPALLAQMPYRSMNGHSASTVAVTSSWSSSAAAPRSGANAPPHPLLPESPQDLVEVPVATLWPSGSTRSLALSGNRLGSSAAISAATGAVVELDAFDLPAAGVGADPLDDDASFRASLSVFAAARKPLRNPRPSPPRTFSTTRAPAAAEQSASASALAVLLAASISAENVAALVPPPSQPLDAASAAAAAPTPIVPAGESHPSPPRKRKRATPKRAASATANDASVAAVIAASTPARRTRSAAKAPGPAVAATPEPLTASARRVSKRSKA